MKYIVLLGRIFFSMIFILSAIDHMSQQTISYAAAQGVPYANFAVPFSGVLEFCGALSILLGFRARRGAWLLVLFLIPVTIMMHAFWKETDGTQIQIQMAMFMKNISMLGAALMITQLGSGPLSLDNRKTSK